MGFYTKQIKRLQQARKAFNQKRNTLREMQLEGITHITLHTATGALSLHVDEDSVHMCISEIYESLCNSRKSLKAEILNVREQQAESDKMVQKERAEQLAAKPAQK